MTFQEYIAARKEKIILMLCEMTNLLQDLNTETEDI
jgi:hypothetical protein